MATRNIRVLTEPKGLPRIVVNQDCVWLGGVSHSTWQFGRQSTLEGRNRLEIVNGLINALGGNLRRLTYSGISDLA